jgi:hypothetical protein
MTANWNTHLRRLAHTIACSRSLRVGGVATTLAILASAARATAETGQAVKPATRPSLPAGAVAPAADTNAAKKRPLKLVDCMASDISTNQGTWETEVRLSGGTIDASCAVDFRPDKGTLLPLLPVYKPAQAGAAAFISVTIPRYADFGSGWLRIYPKSLPPLPQATAPDTGWSFQFSIKSPAPNAVGECDVIATQPTEAAANTEVILWGNNMTNGCAVTFIALPPNFPEQFPASGTPMGGNPIQLDSRRIKVVVPLLQAGTALVKSGRRGMPPGASSATMSIKYMTPVLLSLSPVSGYSGMQVSLAGKAFLPPTTEPAQIHKTHEDLRVRLSYSGRTVDLVPDHAAGPPPIPGIPPAQQVNQLVVTLPTPLPGLTYSESTKRGVSGTISVYRHEPSLSSAALPFTFVPTKSATPPPAPSGSTCPSPGWVSCGLPDKNGSCITMQCCPTQGAGGECNPTKFDNICCKPF